MILRGELGKRFGTRHRFAINTPAEAVRALCVNFKGFERHMVESAERGVAYKVLIGSEALPDVKDVHQPMGQADTVSIVPVIGGAKSGIGGVLLGAALIGASFIPGLQAVTLWGTTTLASVAFNVGVSLALGGISSMLTGTPKATTPMERPENKPSTFFNGPVNTIAQGQPVPIGYGRVICGGAILSVGLDTDDVEP